MNHLIKISPQDLPGYVEQILEIENCSFPSPWGISAFEGELEKSISHLWALIADKRLVGYICFWMFDNEIQVLNLAVHPTNRRQRFGQFLLTRMIETGVSNGLKSVWLEVRPSNLAARNLYSKFGFHQVGRRPRYYRETNEDALIMYLELSRREVNIPISLQPKNLKNN
ncbi:MAG: ribosomal-protein-alanine N-acetyltransferase [Deltaproteobacteria bacterium RBG_19FT_COMBO_46_9]|nr:MAG: ribosomal-protein-alanine N-acetyltransferase [Deltaproteobacteria bacterium RBG_19FT_COMBO_46_9]